MTGLDSRVLERLVTHAGHALGLDVLTGEDWAVVAGSRARLSAFARPWTGPPELAELAAAAGLVLASDLPQRWQTARGPISLATPTIMGILNLTPDSFSDGGRYTTVDAALRQADHLLAAGADLVDLGGESTRPGRPEPVSEAEELGRVLPVLESLVARHPALMISVDTVKGAVASAALDGGAAIINDVSGLRLDPAMPDIAARTGAGVVLMHSRGSVTTMATYERATYAEGVVSTVVEELQAAIDRGLRAGVPHDRIVVDPGFGFSKRIEHNVELLDQLPALTALGRPIMVGPSRKRFLGAVTGRGVTDRDSATAAACALAYERGARLFRVHEPGTTRDALAVAHALGAGQDVETGVEAAQS